MNQEIENKDIPKQSSQDVILVRDKTKNNIQIVETLDKKGTMKTVSATKRNEPQFMRIDRHGDFISNFFTNFISQLHNPTNFSFFKIPEENALEVAKKVQKQLKSPTPELEETLAKYELTSLPENSVHEKYRYDPEEIDWNSMQNIGLGKEYLEQRNLLEPLLKGFKTNELVPISINIGSAIIRTDARLSLQTNSEGKIIPAIHGVRKEPNLNQSFFGHQFTEEDKKNLIETGNMGRVVNLTHFKTQQQIPSIISIDRLTNELVALRSNHIKIPDEIKGVVLTTQQKQQLMQGKSIHLDDMLSKRGTKFSAALQYNADKRYLEFHFDQNTTQKRIQNDRHDSFNEEIPRAFRGRLLDDEQYNKFKNGQSVHLEELLDKNGQKYHGYITLNKETRKADFSFTNPNKSETNIHSSKDVKKQKVDSPKENSIETIKAESPITSQSPSEATKQQPIIKPKGRKM